VSGQQADGLQRNSTQQLILCLRVAEAMRSAGNTGVLGYFKGRKTQSRRGKTSSRLQKTAIGVHGWG